MFSFIGCSLICWGGLSRKDFAFRFLAVSGSVLIAFAAVNIFQRMLRDARYLQTRILKKHITCPRAYTVNGIRQRPPNKYYRTLYVDSARPGYPYKSAGFPPTNITFSTDNKGFRNSAANDNFDIVAVGDSFVEGANVSDEECWPLILGNLQDKSVYNLGMTGTPPIQYLARFVNHGLSLKPKVAIFMIYEGNDFRIHDISLGKRYVLAARQLMRGIPTFESVNELFMSLSEKCECTNSYPELFGWLPLEIPENENRKYYAFERSKINGLNISKTQFRNSKIWLNVSQTLDEIIKICRANGIRLIFVYAPSKAHVVLPLCEEKIDAARINRFAMNSQDPGIISDDKFKAGLFQNLDNIEDVFHEFCQERGVESVRITESLREQILKGEQLYYTYDTHWTVRGHASVAALINDSISDVIVEEHFDPDNHRQ